MKTCALFAVSGILEGYQHGSSGWVLRLLDSKVQEVEHTDGQQAGLLDGRRGTVGLVRLWDWSAALSTPWEVPFDPRLAALVAHCAPMAFADHAKMDTSPQLYILTRKDT